LPLRSCWLAARKGPPVLAAVTRSPGEMVIEDVSGPGPARAGNVIVRPEAVGICGGFPHRNNPGKSKPGVARRAFFASFPAGPRGRGIRIRHETTTGRHQDRGDRELKTKPKLTTEKGER